MSAITRVERAAPIFSRISGLIRSGQMKWEDRPLWYDIYAAFPPHQEPVWDLKMDKFDEPVRKIFYQEDKIRAKFYEQFRSAGVTQIENADKPTVCQQFIQQYEQERKDNPDLSDDEIFHKTVLVLEENGILRRRATGTK